MNVYDLNERIAIVTGGSEGIGLAVVNRILALGGAVSIWVRDRPLLEETVKRIAKSDRVRVWESVATSPSPPLTTESDCCSAEVRRFPPTATKGGHRLWVVRISATVMINCKLRSGYWANCNLPEVDQGERTCLA